VALTRRSTALVVVAATSALVAIGSTQFGQAAQGAPSHPGTHASSTRTEKVIVLLRDQLASTPGSRRHMLTRTSRADRSQQAVLNSLAGRKPTHVHHLALGNAFIATVTEAQAAALRANPAVASVVRNAKVSAQPDVATGPAGATHVTAKKVKPAVAANDPFPICPTDPSQPLLEPEALQSMHVYSPDGSSPSAWQLDKGKGVKVAYIADGIDPDNPNFIRPDGQHAIIDYKDFSGDGPDAPSGGGEAFGDASAIAAQGTVSYDLSDFVNQSYPLPAGCNIRIEGVAPDASIVALKAGGESLTTSSVIQSIDYAVRVDHVNVINESLGLTRFPDDGSRQALELFNDQAVAAGVTVTESPGDGGVTSTIGTDAQDPNVISAGASTDSQLYAQTGYAGARAFGNGKWADNEISALSSSGFTQLGRTIDVVAPGEADWATCEPGFSSCINYRNPAGFADIEAFGGTSQSSPLTAGVAALVISEYRKTHSGASPTPAVVKQIITGTAHDLGLPPFEQGSGLVDARAAVEAAATWPGATTSAPGSVKSNIVTSPNQVEVEGKPGSTQSAGFDVTNVGNKPVDVAAGTRSFKTISESAQAFAFDSTVLPTFPYPTSGAPWAYKKVTFHVPAGAQRLVTRTAWAGSRPPAADAIVRVSLFAPDGTYEANSRPQGGAATANYATVDVRNPPAGTWTAVMYSAAGSAGYTGIIGLDAQSQQAVPEGQISPASFSLAPGASQHLTFTEHMPKKASGDQDVAITLGTSKGQQTVVSAVVRSLIDTSSGAGTFSGNVTGGNARASTPGETFSYAFDVPANQDDVDVALKFNHNPESIMDMALIDPNGELADVVSNLTPNVHGTTLSISRNFEALDADPIMGRWHLVVVVQNPVSGTAFTEPFHGTVSFDGVGASAPALPNSAATVLPAGTPQTVSVDVTNPGPQAILVGVDPRLKQFETLQPTPIQGSTTFPLPDDGTQDPIYITPPDTKSLTVDALSTTPAQLDLTEGAGAGFDVLGDLASAQSGDLLSQASVDENGHPGYISRGLWFTGLQELGPFTDDGQVAGSTTLTASMDTYAFDDAVTSSTDDPYGWAVDPSNNGFGHPVRILPHHTKTITVTITPNADPGTDVKGVLNLVTPSTFPAAFTALPQYTTGAVVKAVPYEYTVGS
jgi:hypothetical protein